MDLEQEAAGGPHELAPKLGGDVLDGHGARVEVPLEAVELRDEVPIELRLQIGEGGLRGLAIHGLEPLQERRRLLPNRLDLRRHLALRLGHYDVEAPLDVRERLAQPLQIDRTRPPDTDRRDQWREALDDANLLGLLVGDNPDDRVDLGHGGELLEGALLLPNP